MKGFGIFFYYEMCAITFLIEIFIFKLCKNLYKQKGSKEVCFALEISDLSAHTMKNIFFPKTHLRF